MFSNIGSVYWLNSGNFYLYNVEGWKNAKYSLQCKLYLQIYLKITWCKNMVAFFSTVQKFH